MRQLFKKKDFLLKKWYTHSDLKRIQKSIHEWNKIMFLDDFFFDFLLQFGSDCHFPFIL